MPVLFTDECCKENPCGYLIITNIVIKHLVI